jgi:hypothetical protein
MAGDADRIGKLVTDRITFVRAWIQEVWSRRDPTHIYEVANETREDLPVVDRGMEVVHVREFSLHMECDFVRAGLPSERCVPRPAPRATKAIEGTGRPAGKCGVDKLCVRNPEDELATIEAVRTNMLRAQAAAGGSFNFREGIEIFIPDQFQQYWIT